MCISQFQFLPVAFSTEKNPGNTRQLYGNRSNVVSPFCMSCFNANLFDFLDSPQFQSEMLVSWLQIFSLALHQRRMLGLYMMRAYYQLQVMIRTRQEIQVLHVDSAPAVMVQYTSSLQSIQTLSNVHVKTTIYLPYKIAQLSLQFDVFEVDK